MQTSNARVGPEHAGARSGELGTRRTRERKLDVGCRGLSSIDAQALAADASIAAAPQSPEQHQTPGPESPERVAPSQQQGLSKTPATRLALSRRWAKLRCAPRRLRGSEAPFSRSPLPLYAPPSHATVPPFLRPRALESGGVPCLGASAIEPAARSF
ncbi:hypothetical protein DB31_0185 [Hyalangium minutum]|uniref:Uncharacterized protein n=1 Tax=Hyalangium minutum TaxID=394096 RepID=A0A085WW61_9BACT|nr:hypothetical protein DB31_0185 [Hyalangium minutum]